MVPNSSEFGKPMVDDQAWLDGAAGSNRQSRIVVSAEALRHNLAVARRFSPGSRFLATIKANGYGHGAVAVAQVLSTPPGPNDTDGYRPADGFNVVTLAEALALRRAGIDAPIMVLQGLREEGDLVHFVEHHLWPVVHASEQWAWYRKAPLARELFTWLKVDTGMGRLGVPPEEATAILADTPASDRVRGVMTHLACADVPGNAHTREQLERFAAIRSLAGEARADSIANSAAVLAWPEAQADWARPGILLYGANPLVEPLPAGVKLVPAMTVTAPLVSVREFRQGQGVGYGQHWHAPEAMPVGHVGIGYGDGLPRLLGEDADVRLGGVACRVLGRVSMDSIAIDLRAVDAKYRQVGQAVTIWGPDNPVDRLAHAAGTISYELLTGIRGRIACQ